MLHLFFASYASLDNSLSDDDREGQLGRVVKSLRERVRAKLGRPTADEVGFFAQSTIKTATEWRDALGTALCKSRVLVCLCSPSFFNSEWCAREFAVFRSRLEQAGAAFAGERVVVPILWEPARASRPMPKALSRFQAKDDGLPARYRQVGLYTLSRLKSQQDDYIETIEQLADVICAAVEGKPLPALADLPPFEKLPRSFDNPGPYSVAVAALHDSGTQWEPSPGQASLGALIESVCSSLQLPWQEVPADLDLLTALAHKRDAREVVVLVTDETSAQSARWRQLLAGVDGLKLDQCAVLYGHSAAPGPASAGSADAEQKLRALLPASSTPGSFHGVFPLSPAEALKKKLEETIVRVRLTIINGDPAQRAESVELAQAASAEGITVGTAPTVNGPGGDGR